MLTNDIKKGMRIQLRNGWYATVLDNKKGNTRLCEVEGTYTEMGSVYGHDIMRVKQESAWVAVEHTEAQKKNRQNLIAMGLA